MNRALVENRGDSRFFASAKGGTFVMDTAGNGIGPIDALLASLCGCIGHHVKSFLSEQGLNDQSFAVSAEASLVSDKTRLGEIRVLLNMKGCLLSEQQKTLLLTYAERCKIHATLKSSCKIEVSLSY